jgi:hypothetical protein
LGESGINGKRNRQNLLLIWILWSGPPEVKKKSSPFLWPTKRLIFIDLQVNAIFPAEEYSHLQALR